MSNRIQLLSNHLAQENSPQAEYLKEPLSFLRLEDLIPTALNLKRKSQRQFLEREIQPNIPDLYDKADFPLSLLPKLKHMFGLPDGKYCKKVSHMETFLNVFEASRIDASIGAFIGVMSTVIQTVYYLASEEQKSDLLPKISNMEMLVSWAYSEPETGSYSTSLQTTAELVEGGFVLRGMKRWVGNYNFSHILVWARNSKSKLVEAFLISAKQPGVKLEVTKGKFSARLTQTGLLSLESVLIPLTSRFSSAQTPESMLKIFELARTGLAMASTGILAGVYEHLIKYLSKKTRFGAPLTSYQMIQEKLVRILAIFNNSFLLAWRVIELQEKGVVTLANTALVKATVTAIGKDAVRIAREMMGSNGIALDNFVMKALVDMEAYYNLENTQNVSILIAGRGITGISGFMNKYNPNG